MADLRRLGAEMGYVGYLSLPSLSRELMSYTGDVVYTTIFGKPIVVLNSIDAARDLLDKKGSNFSDRPRAVAWNEL